jgi:hypothetical protein
VVPAKYVGRFVGREELLQRLRLEVSTALAASSRPRRFVIQALGGHGKSQVALEFCRRSKTAGLFRGIFWVNATSQATTTRDFEIIASRFDPSVAASLPDSESKREFVKQKLESWRECWLLVFDNYDNVDAFGDIGEFFPLGEIQDIAILVQL